MAGGSERRGSNEIRLSSTSFYREQMNETFPVLQGTRSSARRKNADCFHSKGEDNYRESITSGQTPDEIPL